MDSQLNDLAVKLVPYLQPWLLAYGSAYVTGTWTPTYVGLTTAGTTTYSAQAGYYTRIGNTVIAQGRVVWTAATGTGNAVISLPFATGSGYTRVAITIYTENVTFGALTPYAMADPGTNLFRLWTPASNAASTAINVEAAGELVFLAVYFV